MSVRRATALAAAVLVALDGLLTAVGCLVAGHAAAAQDAATLAARARFVAFAAARGRTLDLPPWQPARLADFLWQPLGYGVVVLVVGMLALALLRGGRRWVWLPVAAAGLPFGSPMLLLGWDQTAANLWLGRAAQFAVVACAGGMLLALGGRALPRDPVPLAVVARRLVVPAVLVGGGIGLWMAGPNHGDTASAPAALAALALGGLLGSSRLALTTRVVAGLAAALAVPAVAGGLVVTPLLLHTAPSLSSQYAEALAALALVAVGAAAAVTGLRAAATWRALARRPATA